MTNPDRTIVNDRYEIHERIGRGGMADVFLARDLLLDRLVAIKVLFPEFATDPAFVERFRREAQSAANLNHPNIVAVYDWGRAGTTYFIAMEYVQGRTLADMLHARGRLTADQAADVAIEVAGALAFAHQSGVVHRDVKPANILIANTGQVKVADFGIARAVNSGAEDNLTQTGAVMGTATYFSPEQAQGAQPDPRSDLYSLGIVLYEMVCGQPPFIGDSQVAIAYKQVHEAPRPLNQIVPEIPRQFEAVIAKCLAKNPDVRYGTASELRDDIKRYKDGQPVQAWQQAVGNTGQTPVTTMMPAVSANDASTTVVPKLGPTTQVMPQTPGDGGGGNWPPYEDDPQRSPFFYILSAIVAIAVVVGAVFVVLNATKNDSTSGPLEVPELINRSYTDAAKELIDLGLVPVPDPVKSETVDPGVVYAQNPLPGVVLRKGDSVTLTYNPDGAPVQVPSLAGLTITEATQALAAVGLNLQISETRIDPQTPINQVISQTPLANETATEGSVVLVVVSGGAGDVQVPDVSGQTSTAAQNLLQATPYQFVVSVLTETSTSVPQGQVIRTDPSSGSAAVSGDKITIYISAGPDQIQVPDVLNMTQAEAESTLSNAGLGFSVQTTLLQAGDPKIGRIVDQGTDPGTMVNPGTVIKIYLGVKAPKPTTTTTSPATTTTTVP
jgi:serine/threonine-protein kinase